MMYKTLKFTIASKTAFLLLRIYIYDVKSTQLYLLFLHRIHIQELMFISWIAYFKIIVSNFNIFVITWDISFHQNCAFVPENIVRNQWNRWNRKASRRPSIETNRSIQRFARKRLRSFYFHYFNVSRDISYLPRLKF